MAHPRLMCRARLARQKAADRFRRAVFGGLHGLGHLRGPAARHVPAMARATWHRKKVEKKKELPLSTGVCFVYNVRVTSAQLGMSVRARVIPLRKGAPP